MHRDRVEETILVLVAVLLTALLAPFSLTTRLVTTVSIAVALVLLLVLRSADWHEGGATPFDEVLLAGVALSVVHLVSILASTVTIIGQALLVAAAAFYAAMALFLARHRGWLFGERNDG